MKDFYTSLNESTLVLLSLSIILFAGFLLTRLTKRLHLPNVSGYILAGVLIGPQVASLVPAHILSHMGFISDVALAFIAFGVGKFFKKEVLMKTGWKVVIVTLWESVLAGILITSVLGLLSDSGRHRYGNGSCQHNDDHPAVPGQRGFCKYPPAGGRS